MDKTEFLINPITAEQINPVIISDYSSVLNLQQTLQLNICPKLGERLQETRSSRNKSDIKLKTRARLNLKTISK